ncbi:MAG: lamin tail domain-containing protein [Myxococcota bacterium]
MSTSWVSSARAALVITEVYVDTSLAGAGDADEFIEIANTGPGSVSLASYAIGDDESPGTGSAEGFVRFPSGATLGPDQIALVVKDGTEFDSGWPNIPAGVQVFAVTANSATGTQVQMGAAVAGWGTTQIGLGNSFDEALLAHEDSPGVWSLTDGVSWGGSAVTTMTPLGGVATTFMDATLSVAGGIEGSSFVRKSANLDTNHASDWRKVTPATPGVAPFAVCGDSVVAVGETCDDGGEVPGDGCDAFCQTECGFTCAGVGPDSCAADCGDGDVAGGEACDDGNTNPDDGCSPFCTVEIGWVCTPPAPACDAVETTHSTCAVDPCQEPLRITEVHVDGLLDNDSEWIELTNAGTIPIDLDPWTVTDQATQGASGEAAASFAAGDALAPGATIVLAYSSEQLGTDFGVAADFEYGTDSDPAVPQLAGASTWAPGGPILRLANDQDQVLLTCGNVVRDALRWGPTPDALTLPAPGPEYDAQNLTRGPTTYERIAPDLDSGKASDFVLSSCPTPGVGRNPNAAPDAGPALVNVPAGQASTLYLPGDDRNGDALTFSIDATGTLGTVTLVSASTGEVRYTPPAGPGPFTATFSYRVADACVRSAPATVTVLVAPAVCDPGLAQVKLTEVHIDAATDNDGEWIELTNNGATSVSLAFARLGDEATPGGSEGMFVFPQATLGAGQSAVVAFSARTFEADWGIVPDYEWNRDSDGIAGNDLLRAATWARGTIRLDNDADEVLLIGCDGHVLDAVYWGATSAEGAGAAETPWATRLPAPPGYTAAPGQHPTTYTRKVPTVDTNSAADWALESCPSPVEPVSDNRAPVPTDGRYPLAMNGTLNGTLAATDADLDALTYAVGQAPSGVLTLTDPTTGAFTYAPPAGFVGIVSFSFTASDDCRTSTGTVTVCVGTSEVVGNGIDDDCDGTALCYVDQDGDGFGTSATIAAGAQGCAGGGRAAVSGDCDDDPAQCGAACKPTADEICDGKDNDCAPATVDGSEDPLLGSACDAAGDANACPDDARICSGGVLVCADVPTGDAGRVEVCDPGDLDEDCDGGADDLDPQGTPANATTWYHDKDNDGWGDSAETLVKCNRPVAYVAQGGDCADAVAGCAAACNPGVTESRASGNCADGFDNDCDNQAADQDAECFSDVVCHADKDGDGFGASAVTVTLTGPTAAAGCAAYADGTHAAGYWVVDGTDCDDEPTACGAACHPGLPELCDGKNNDCIAGTVDGANDVRVGGACDSPDDNDKCLDDLAACTAGAIACPNSAAGDAQRVEVCDAQDIDEDCDGGADDADPQGTPATGTRTVFRDDDGDGRGRTNATLVRCDVPAGYAALGGDCDDDPAQCGASCRPGLTESKGAADCADSRDNDCDGATDTDPECFGEVLCYLDLDGDHYGTAASEIVVSGPAGDAGCGLYNDGVHAVGSWVDNGLDCDDDVAKCGAACHPDAPDVCDGKDNDCSPATADGSNDARVGVACDATGDGDKCQDDRQGCQTQGVGAGATGVIVCVNITATDASQVERCDAVHADEDCDGGGDDADPDGSPADAPLWYRDADGDGYGLASTQVRRCVAPLGYVGNGLDCQDDPTGCGAACHPGAAELCDGFDNDCSVGTADGAEDPDVGVPCDSPEDQDKCLDEISVCETSVKCKNDTEGDVQRIEVCDPADVDEDCDGGADDADPQGGPGTIMFHRDRDGDGHGDPGALVAGCDPGPGRVVSDDDCDDDPSACGAACHPVGDGDPGESGAQCDNGYDDDCDGRTDLQDEGCVSSQHCFADADGDGYGNDATTIALPLDVSSCAAYADGTHAAGYWVSAGGDCAPADRDVHPDAAEVVGNDVDEDCSGRVACWVDGDNDEYARDDAQVVDAAPGETCKDAFGLAGHLGDCDDDPTACGAACSPPAIEICDQRDNDCDGDTDEIPQCAEVPPTSETVLNGGSGCAVGAGTAGQASPVGAGALELGGWMLACLFVLAGLARARSRRGL